MTVARTISWESHLRMVGRPAPISLIEVGIVLCRHCDWKPTLRVTATHSKEAGEPGTMQTKGAKTDWLDYGTRGGRLFIDEG